MAAFSARIKSWHRWTSLQIIPADDLYLGAGQTAQTIIKSSGLISTNRYRRQVAIDPVELTVLNEVFNNSPKCFVLQADATQFEILRKANLTETGRVWVVAGDDKRNISILENLIFTEREFLDTSEPKNESTKAIRRWFVDIANSDTVRLASTLFKNPPGVVIEYFNIERLAARSLVQDFVKNVLPPLCKGPAATPILNLCVVGSTELAEALILHSIQQLVVSENPESCLRITWIAGNASERMSQLKERIPALGDMHPNEAYFSGLLPLARVNCVDTDERNISPATWIESQKDSPFSAVYIACEDELLSGGSLLRISALRDLAAGPKPIQHPIVLCYWDKLPDWAAKVPLNGVSYFHVTGKIFRSGENYPGENMDELAKLVNSSYSIPPDSPKPESSFVEMKWATLDPWSRWSSRMSADHSAVKDALITNWADAESDIKGRATRLTSDEVERNLDFLAALEHRRFVIERLIEGWLPLKNNEDSTPSGFTYSQQKNLLRLNKTLVTYRDLPEEEKLKIAPSIRALPTLITWLDYSKTKSKI